MNDNIITNKKELAETFNDFFTSCVDQIRNNNLFPQTPLKLNKLSSFIKKQMNNSNKKFSIPPIKVDEVYSALSKLDINKSSGCDNIGAKVLRLCAPYIASPITYIFNRMIDTSCFPKELKNAKVTPIYKAGDRLLTNNYRPISVLPTLSKIIERHVAHHVYLFLSEFKLLHPAQSGFRPNHSCQTALINIIDKWLQEMNNGNINLAVLVDFKKAFDVVDHMILCQKLEVYRFCDNTVNFFKSYLSERTQQVKLCNVFSEKRNIEFGVPQGSILGPLLFVLFINDLPLYIKNCTTDLYADDSTLHLSGKNVYMLEKEMQNELNSVEVWCRENNMYINTSKSKCMLIGTKPKLSTIEIQPRLEIFSEFLNVSACEKILGIQIDANLIWKEQIDMICKNISSRIYLLSQIKSFLNLETKKIFYNGYILPLIDYCCIIWGGCNNDSLDRILKLQKRAARLILDTDPLAPSAPLFKQLGIMTVQLRIKYHKYLLLHKTLKGDAPEYLIQKFNYLSSNIHYGLRNVLDGNLMVPKQTTELYKKSFAYSGAVLWNELPPCYRNTKNTQTFKHCIKKYLSQD